MMIKRYSELIKLDSFLERYRYLKLRGCVGEETFGSDRYVNQVLYSSKEWRSFRREIILRDECCDLGMNGFEIEDQTIIIHHMNPITLDDILERRQCIFDPENVITTIIRTHNAIHYGDESLLNIGPLIRTVNDTCPWKN